MSRARAIALALLAGAALLVPLYGDPRRSPVTHPEWARLLIRGLDLEGVVGPGATASLVFDSLTWRASRSLDAGFFRSDGVSLVEGPPRLIRADANGEVAYRIAVTRGGDYALRLHVTGAAGTRFAAEVTPDGDTKPIAVFDPTLPGATSGTQASRIDAGTVYMKPGVYTISVALPQGSALHSLEVAPPCVAPIEPPGGWKPTAVARTGEVAVTLLQALDLEHQLAPAAAPIELPSLGFQPIGAQVLQASVTEGDAMWLRASTKDGLRAVAFFDLPEAGRYTVSAFGYSGGGQSWLTDACHKSVLCPAARTPETPGWHPLFTMDFAAGRHSMAVALEGGAGITKLRFERKRDSPEDYLAALSRLGLDLGPDAPISRAKAADALQFLKAQRALQAAACSDLPSASPATIFSAGTRVAGSTLPGAPGGETGGETGGGEGGGNGGGPTGSGPDPLGPPPIPLPVNPSPVPTPSASPTPSPSPTPTPTPSPSPSASPTPSPTPTIGPPPTIPTPPPGTPVLPPTPPPPPPPSAG